MKKIKISLILLCSVIIVDQVVKILVKTNMVLGQEYSILGNWFRLHFTENNGMAFGMELGGENGKRFLTIFRIIAASLIAWYLYDLIKKGYPNGLVISITLILAGAIGNSIDSLFYGMIFSDSYFNTATLFPPEGGYTGILLGQVVDMLYFPVINTYLPDWFPVWPNRHFIFFRPVFNISDSAITIGVSMILIFQKRYFKDK